MCVVTCILSACAAPGQVAMGAYGRGMLHTSARNGAPGRDSGPAGSYCRTGSFMSGGQSQYGFAAKGAPGHRIESGSGLGPIAGPPDLRRKPTVSDQAHEDGQVLPLGLLRNGTDEADHAGVVGARRVEVAQPQ